MHEAANPHNYDGFNLPSLQMTGSNDEQKVTIARLQTDLDSANAQSRSEVSPCPVCLVCSVAGCTTFGCSFSSMR